MTEHEYKQNNMIYFCNKQTPCTTCTFYKNKIADIKYTVQNWHTVT